MTRLSVNINKFATLRNARGGNNPDICRVAEDCQQFGADGITVHPRPDERHIRYQDVLDLRPLIYTEFNIEGRPDDRFLDLVLRVKPDQCTLVPDAASAITSNAGWDTWAHQDHLKEVVARLNGAGIRTSIFVDPVPKMIEGAALSGTNRVELYTEGYAKKYASNPLEAVENYTDAAALAASLGLGINAGHDLDLINLRYFNRAVHRLDEVSIGHALVCDAIYLGLENTIQLYKRELAR